MKMNLNVTSFTSRSKCCPLFLIPKINYPKETEDINFIQNFKSIILQL